jgi:hypothetical protein
MKMKTLMKVLLLLCTLMAGMECATAQTTFIKWKLVENPSALQTNDEVVIVDLTTSNAMRNNPEYEEGNTVSKASPPAAKITLKEELDRIVSECADTIVWTAVYGDGLYQFKFLNEENKTRYLFESDQNLRVGFVSEDNASKRKFDIDKGLLHRKIQTDEEVYKDYHLGIKVASGIMAMMSGSTWELMADSVNAEASFINKEIAATKMAFFKKVVTSLPDPTLHFPQHDYEADVQQPGSFESPVAIVDEAGAGSISYYSGNTELAEVDATTGAVTVKKRGTVRIYARISATDSYDEYLTSYILRIDDSETAGGRNHPFTVAEAIAYAKEDHAEETANGVCYFVKGIVSSVGGAMAGMEGMEDMMEMMSGMMEGMEGMEGFDMSAMLSMFLGEQEPGTLSYGISDNGAAHDELPVNNGRGLQLADLTENGISVGDEVTVYGPLEYSEDNDMMSMMGGSQGGDGEDKRTVKMPRVNYLQEQVRNLITNDIILYYGQTKQTDDLFSITNMFGGTLVTNHNAQDNTLPKTSLKPSDTDVAYWVVNSENTDSLLTPKKSGIITVTVNAPVLLQSGDTIKMKRKFNLDVRDRQVLPAGTMVGNYELVTDASQLNDGDKLLIVATIDNKPKVLNRKVDASGSSDSSNPMASLLGGGSNGSNITIGDDGKISEVPDDAQILTLEEDGDKWLLQTGRTADYQMTYLYVSDTTGGSTSMIPGMGSNGAKLKTGTRETVSDSCKVSFTFLPEKDDSVKIQFNFADREEDGKPVTAKNVIRYEKGTMSSSFGGFEPESDKATLPRLYRLVQADQYSFTVSDAMWATIVSSYDVTLPEEVKGYAVVAVTDNNVQLGDELTSLKGGEPYLLHSETEGIYTLTKATSAVSAPATNKLKISDSDTGDGVYVLANGADGPGFYRWMGGKLGAGRVYLPVTSSASAFLPFVDGETTAIETMTDGRSEKYDACYSLDGRRLNGIPAHKGIYIYNGKKIAQ